MKSSEETDWLRWARLGPVMLLGLAWLAWFFFAHVAVYEVSDSARVEVLQQSQTIDAPVSGQIVSESLEVGRQVRAGDVLVSLDAEGNRRQLEEAQAQFRQADAAARFSEEEVRKLEPLSAAGQIGRMDLARARTEAQRARATADGWTATIQRLTYELSRRQVRAPIDGEIGERSAALHVGSMVKEGDRLGSVIPHGELRGVALFPPSSALGHLREGQAGRLLLDGFPSAQYGSVRAQVSSVAKEVRDGKVRVEVAIQPDSNPRIPLQHGLPGSLEIAVERVTPATLVLRTAGAWVGHGR